MDIQSNKIWKSQRYQLVFEYYHKPLLPPPFAIFSYILVFIRYLIRIIWIVAIRQRTYKSAKEVIKKELGGNKFGDKIKRNFIIKQFPFGKFKKNYIFNI